MTDQEHKRKRRDSLLILVFLLFLAVSCARQLDWLTPWPVWAEVARTSRTVIERVGTILASSLSRPAPMPQHVPSPHRDTADERESGPSTHDRGAEPPESEASETPSPTATMSGELTPPTSAVGEPTENPSPDESRPDREKSPIPSPTRMPPTPSPVPSASPSGWLRTPTATATVFATLTATPTVLPTETSTPQPTS